MEKSKKWLIHGLIWVVAILFLYSQIRGCSSNKEEVVKISEARKVEKEQPVYSTPEPKSSPSPVAVVDPNASILKGTLDGLVVELEKCNGNGDELSISGYMLNSGIDASVFIFVGDEYIDNHHDDDNSTMYDDGGNYYLASLGSLGNVSSRVKIESKLISGIKTAFKINFKGLQTVGGELRTKKVAVFTMRGKLGGRPFNFQFRNIKLNEILGTTPTPVQSPTPTPTTAENTISTVNGQR